MRALTAFFTSVWRSMTDPAFYREVRGKTLGSAVGYLYVLLVLTVFITTIPVAGNIMRLRGPMQQFLSDSGAGARELFPADLVITVEKGKVSTNSSAPVRVPVPAKWKPYMQEPNLAANGPIDAFLVIDPKARAEDLRSLRTIFLVTEQSIVVLDDSGSSKIIPLDADTSLTIDRKTYDEAIDAILPFIRYADAALPAFLVALIVAFPFLGAGLSLLGALLALFVQTWIVSVVGMVQHRRIPYWELYRLCVRGLTLPVVALAARDIIAPGMTFPLLGTVILVCWMGYVISKIEPARPT